MDKKLKDAILSRIALYVAVVFIAFMIMLAAASCLARPEICRTDCRTDSGGHLHCKTVCR